MITLRGVEAPFCTVSLDEYSTIVAIVALTLKTQQIIGAQVAAIRHQHNNQSATASMVAEEKPPRTTVFHDLLESKLPAHENTAERLTQEGVGLISAAGETTSTALAATMFHLLSDLSLVACLRSELIPVMPNSRICAEWRDLETLPLLVSGTG